MAPKKWRHRQAIKPCCCDGTRKEPLCSQETLLAKSALPLSPPPSERLDWNFIIGMAMLVIGILQLIVEIIQLIV